METEVSVEQIIERGFGSLRVLVVGDLVADQFLRGNIARVSREAPVFILRHEETATVGGGAANTATNAAALGAQVSLVGLIGDDPNAIALKASLHEAGVDTTSTVSSSQFQTTTKLRVLAGQQYALRQQVIRVDYENDPDAITAIAKEELRHNALAALEATDVVILSDYGYGVADDLFNELIEVAAEKGIPSFVDSRKRLAEFKGATAATPNKEETEELIAGEYSAELGKELRDKLGLEVLLVTLGNQGMVVFENDTVESIPIVGSDTPVDVTGAGDTVISTFALCRAVGLTSDTSARIANHAGGIVVMQQGTVAIRCSDLLGSIKKYQPELLTEVAISE